MINTRENASNDSLHQTVQHDDLILTYEARRVLETIFYTVLGGLIGVLGSAANVINIVVFLKQGFMDSVSVSLCALAVSDLSFLLSMIVFSICSNPLVHISYIGIDFVEIFHTTGGTFESCVVRIINLITAFITFERCVCIALPLKVKNIITPKRTFISMVLIYVILFSTNLPIFSLIDIAPPFNDKRNKTLIRLTYTSQSLPNFSYSFNAFTQIISFIIVIMCTAVLVLKLLSKSQWRQKVISPPSASNSLSTRDKRVIKMVIAISTTFIACYLPSVINLLLMVYLSPEYNASGLYEGSYSVSWAFIDTIDGINSSVTILIYYNMSSRFNETFKDTFFIFIYSSTKMDPVSPKKPQLSQNHAM